MASGLQPCGSFPSSLLKYPVRQEEEITKKAHHSSDSRTVRQPVAKARGCSLWGQQRWEERRKTFYACPRVVLLQKPVVWFSQNAESSSSSYFRGSASFEGSHRAVSVHPPFLLKAPNSTTSSSQKGRDLFPMCKVSLHPQKCRSMNSALRWAQQVRFMAEACSVLRLWFLMYIESESPRIRQWGWVEMFPQADRAALEPGVWLKLHTHLPSSRRREIIIQVKGGR